MKLDTFRFVLFAFGFILSKSGMVVASNDSCCSLDYKNCIDWCGNDYNSCMNCNADNVGWISKNVNQSQCSKRWVECNQNSDCCDGLTCQENNNFSSCLPAIASNPTKEPTKSPTKKPVKSPTKSPTNPPVALEGCYSINYKDCLPKSFDDDSKSCTKVWLPEGTQQNCLALWYECDDSSDCCGSATCFGDGSYSVCIPEPTGPPVEGCYSINYKDCLPKSFDDDSMTCNNKVWLPEGAQQSCLALWYECDDSSDCCGSATCLGNSSYSVCAPESDSPIPNPTKSPVSKPTKSPVSNPTKSPVKKPTKSPTSKPTKSPVKKPTKSPTSKPTKSPVPAPTGGGNGCCSLDYKNCITWCGSTYGSCMECDNSDGVTWLPNGPQSQCQQRWDGCDGNPNGCCNGLTCQWRTGFGYNACLPNLDPTPAPVPAPPTKTPTVAPTLPPVPTISPAPTSKASLLSTDKALNAWEVFLGLDYITHKNSPTNYALVASGGAAGGGNLVVSESQAYGLLITGTVLASWNTHAGKVPNSKRSEVLKYFEGYYNFWKQMCKDSTPNPKTNCQPDGNYCKDSSGGSYVCLPDWRHYKTGGSESTGPAPDADEDAITGIMLAVKAVENDKNKPSWYNEARKWADASATAFYEYEVDTSKAGFALVKLGSCWGGWEKEGNNPSYHSPGSFRAWKDYQKNFPNKLRNGYKAVSQSDWKELINTSHDVLRAVQCENDGALVPNWATIGVSGGKIKHSGAGFSGSGTPQYEYGAEAARTTFRVALDAALYPEKADEWSPYLSSFNWMLDGGYQNGSFSSNTFPSCRGPNTNQNINMFGGWLNNQFISGPTFTSLIASSPDIGNAEAMIDAAGAKMAQSLPGSYYPRSWAMISNLMLNGAMESAGNTLKK